MTMIGRSKIAVFSFSLLVASTVAALPAYAACAPGDVQGNWWLHGMTYDGGIGTTIRCWLKVKADGSIRAGTKCVEKTVDDQGTFEQTAATTAAGKSLKVSTTCKVSGGFKVKVDNADVIGTNVSTIESAQLSQDGEIVTGVGRGVFNGTAKDLEFPVSSSSVFYFTLNKR